MERPPYPPVYGGAGTVEPAHGEVFRGKKGRIFDRVAKKSAEKEKKLCKRENRIFFLFFSCLLPDNHVSYIMG